MVKARREASKDYYIVDFSGDPCFDLPNAEGGKPQAWTMFTHGILAALVDNHLDFHRIAISGRHMASPSEAVLMERLAKAALTLRYRGETAGCHPLTARQCLLASEILRQELGQLVSTLLASEAPITTAEPGTV